MIADRRKFKKIKIFQMKKSFTDMENFLSYIGI